MHVLEAIITMVGIITAIGLILALGTLVFLVRYIEDIFKER